MSTAECRLAHEPVAPTSPARGSIERSIELGQPLRREDLRVGVQEAQPPVLEMRGGVGVGGEVLNRLGSAQQAMLDALKRCFELGRQRLGDVVQEHHQLVLGAGRAPSVGGQELPQRSGPEGAPDEVHDRDHREDTNGER